MAFKGPGARPAFGALAIVGGVVTFVLGSGKKSDLEKKCPESTCSYGSDAERRAGGAWHGGGLAPKSKPTP